MREELPNYHNSTRIIRSFGRIKSRKLSGHKESLLNELLPRYQIKELATDLLRQEYQKLALEIGFGFGDFLFEKAQKNPDTIFLGVEPHLNGVVNLLSKLEVNPLKNIRISTADSRILFADNKLESCLDEVFILFPDPWPKAKHFKRRLINQEFLDDFLAPKMKNNSKLVIATDHDSYKTWILAAILRSKKFLWTANSKQDWQNFPDDWTVTKYQRKAAAEGRQSVIFNLICKNV